MNQIRFRVKDLPDMRGVESTFGLFNFRKNDSFQEDDNDNKYVLSFVLVTKIIILSNDMENFLSQRNIRKKKWRLIHRKTLANRSNERNLSNKFTRSEHGWMNFIRGVFLWQYPINN